MSAVHLVSSKRLIRCPSFSAVGMEDTSLGASEGEINDDDWHNVTNTKKRKQIQDWLAQRARRT